MLACRWEQEVVQLDVIRIREIAPRLAPPHRSVPGPPKYVRTYTASYSEKPRTGNAPKSAGGWINTARLLTPAGRFAAMGMRNLQAWVRYP